MGARVVERVIRAVEAAQCDRTTADVDPDQLALADVALRSGPDELRRQSASRYSWISQSVTASEKRRTSLRLIAVNAWTNCSPSFSRM